MIAATMTLDSTTYRIFVASPSDVTREGELVSGIVREMNLWTSLSGLNLEVTCWKTDIFPGFHPEGPQGLIDEHLGVTDCNLFLAIFWHRFGSPTSSGETGTEHEFRTAYDSWKARRRPDIALYFNEQAYSPVSADDAAQWASVLRFRDSLPPEAFLWNYNGAVQFEDICRGHLTRRFVDLIKERQSAVAQAPDLPKGSLQLVLRNSSGDFLGEPVEVFLRDLVRDFSYEITVASLDGNCLITGLSVKGSGAYWVLVRTRRYFSAARSVILKPEVTARLEITLPMRSDQIADYIFPAGQPLQPAVRKLLDSSGRRGRAAYKAALPIERATLHNVAAILQLTGLPDAHSLLDHVVGIFSLHEDRCLLSVSREVLALARKSGAQGLLKTMPTALHDPPDGYHCAIGLRRHFGFCLLSLCFYVHQDGRQSVVDCDVEATGLEEIYRVEPGYYAPKTKPSDFYQALSATLNLDLGYTIKLLPRVLGKPRKARLDS